MNELRLSIVIVNYNVKFFLEQCLYSVLEAAANISSEIIVVDNASTDGSVEYLRSKFPSIKFVENAENLGFAKANNQALQMCRGKYVLLLNPDTVIGDCLQQLCDYMDEHSDVGAVGVKMLNEHGEFLPESKRSFPSPWVSFCKMFGLAKLFPKSKSFAAYSLSYLNPDERHSVEVLAGAFMFMRRSALDKTGFLDEAFFMYGEDIDLSYRMILNGYKNLYLPFRILHYKGKSTKKKDKKYLDNFYGAMLIFFKKYYPNSRIFAALIGLAISLRKTLAGIMVKQENGVEPRKRTVLVFANQNEKYKLNAVIADKIPHSSLQFGEYSEMPETTKYTDIVFVRPDVAFDKILQFMDTNPDKAVTYHIYHSVNDLFI